MDPLDGSQECVAAGIVSSLQGVNVRLHQALRALGYSHTIVIGRVLAQTDAQEPITLRG